MLITSHDAVVSALKEHGVIPDVIDEFQVSGLLTLHYGKEKDVNLGNQLTIEATAKSPNVWFATDDQNTEDQFTRANPIRREWRHWVVGNIPANAELNKATTLTTYNGPTPPPGTGKHRYVFVLFKQPQCDIKYDPLPESREKFNTREFAKKYGLEIVTANFFFCEN
ncbi:7679_t:CDS:2 [Ambispora gerdemannii]|uniref:7679_t:CDS:1 n=1 Tax=Ambispora gerdemannii TaxID=144530 RepID=A0A9N8V7J1_9GLOM|nr:7679_t:CDS:2 [Ambispora gerdemannii]